MTRSAPGVQCAAGLALVRPHDAGEGIAQWCVRGYLPGVRYLYGVFKLKGVEVSSELPHTDVFDKSTTKDNRIKFFQMLAYQALDLCLCWKGVHTCIVC